jgi:hypothetical protein
LVVLNFGDEDADVFVPGDMNEGNMRLLMSTASEHPLDNVQGRRLHPWEGRLYRCQRKATDA